METRKWNIPNNSQHTIMLADIVAHGAQASGVYKNIPWRMTRPYNTYWCGYVEYYGCDMESKYTLTDEDYKRLEALSHKGLTSGIGFDCAHGNDYAPLGSSTFTLPGSTFRTYDYVYGKITDMIDYIVSAAEHANKENVPPLDNEKTSSK